MKPPLPVPVVEVSCATCGTPTTYQGTRDGLRVYVCVLGHLTWVKVGTAVEKVKEQG